MTASESKAKAEAEEPKESAPPPGDKPFLEQDGEKTVIPYDKGGLPIYIALAWVGFIIAYVTVMSLVALPDLKAWLLDRILVRNPGSLVQRGTASARAS